MSKLPTNVLRWTDDKRTRWKNSRRETEIGKDLDTALAIIEAQYDEIQEARNDLIDMTERLREEQGHTARAQRASVPDEVAEHVRTTPRKQN